MRRELALAWARSTTAQRVVSVRCRQLARTGAVGRPKGFVGAGLAPQRHNRSAMRRGAIASCLLVLVSVAGASAFGRSSTAEAGTSGVWSVAASVITGREEHTATLLQDGTVLVTGGTDGRDKVLASAELYNPKTNRWVPAGTMMGPGLITRRPCSRMGKCSWLVDWMFPSHRTRWQARNSVIRQPESGHRQHR